MPMDFPDMSSLKRAAKVHKFREKATTETEVEYRSALADHVESIDFVESQEIRHSVGWDQWTDDQARDGLRRKGLSL